MSDTVTLNRTHFEALLRRAEFYSADSQYLQNSQPGIVSISKEEYDGLRQSEKDLQTLRNTLLDGGLAPETLDVLIQGSSGQPRKDSAFVLPSHTETQKIATTAPEQHSRYARRGTPANNAEEPTSSDAPGYSWPQPAVQEHLQIPKQGLTWQQQRDFGARPASPLSFDDAGDEAMGIDYDQGKEGPFPHRGQRTLLITGLSDRITYKDLTNVIRGGRILYLTIRKDLTAIVFMLEGAAEFLAHVKRHDLYVQTKRLGVRWNEHQFSLTPYVGHKIAAGASRNLVLRDAAHVAKIADIREHMEHIHKFEIVDIVTRGRDIYVYTNSVHNALFARTCMMSRRPYKGLKIEFFPDECAAPLPRRMIHGNQTKATTTASKSQAPKNLFEMLSLDSDGENRVPGREDDDDNTIDDDDDDEDESDYGMGVSLAV